MALRSVICQGRGARSGTGATFALACLGAALLWACGPQVPGAAQVPTQSLQASAGDGGACGQAINAGNAAFDAVHQPWADSVSSGRLVRSFGQESAAAVRLALEAFDAAAPAGQCASQRKSLETDVQQKLWDLYAAQRAMVEQYEGGAFMDRMLTVMRKRGGPLRVQEKMDLLRRANSAYKNMVAGLTPPWAADDAAAEHAKVESRFAELQFRIEETAEGSYLTRVWQRNKEKSVLNERAHGISVSLDPALRVMVRPEGLGNVQIYSTGPAGPPDSPLAMNIGIINDASMADVYREHPVPPLFAVQPAVRLNVNLR